MSVAPLTIIAASLIPALGAVAGAAIAVVRPPGPTVRSGVQHFAAGVVFAAVAGELLPEVLDIHKPVQVVIGFAIGIGLMLLIRRLTEPAVGLSADAVAEDPLGLLITVGVDLFIDGLLVGIGFAAGSETGVLLVIALTLEVVFLGLSTSVEMIQAQIRAGRTVATVAVLAALLVFGAAVGAFLLSGLSDGWLEVVLGFGAAALLYLVTEELLVEAHDVPETPVTTALFFAGFLALLVIEMLA